jgi:protoporphyrin/coproporphyrin ferrochelatase
VREYLREFLSDPRVVALPRWLWLPVLHGIVLRTRPAKSAEKYRQVWTAQGSPLAVHTMRQAALLQDALETPVRYAMRYGEPSVSTALEGLEEPVVVPLYPQYAQSTTASVADVLPKGVPMVRSFHDHPGYIAALAAGVRRHWQARGRGELLVMSFHGLPRRGASVYEEQCHQTGKLLSSALDLDGSEYKVTFQSRFGYAEWLQPYTEPTLVGLARAGRARIDVACPGFVADCLETLEEIGIAARRAFLAAGGRELGTVPCLNESAEWISALGEIARGRLA